MAESIQAVHVEFSATTKQLRAEMTRGSAAVKKFGSSMKRNMGAARSSGKSLSSTFGALRTAVAAVGLGFFVRDLVRVGVEAEKASGVIAGLGKNVRDNLGQINQSGRELVLQYGASLADVQAAQFDYLSATQDVAGANAAVGESLKLAIAGGAEAATTMDAMTTIMGTYSLSGVDAARVSEALFRAQQRGKVTMDQLSSSIGNVATSARAAGVSYQDMLATLASVTSGGLGGEKTQAGATSVAKLYDAIAKAGPNVIQISREMAQEAGVLDFEFSKAQLATDGLAVFLEKMSRVVKGDLIALTKLGIQTKAAKGTQILLKDEAAATTANLEDQARVANELGAAMAFMADTTGNATDRVSGIATVFKVEVLDNVVKQWREDMKGLAVDYETVATLARQLAGGLTILSASAVLFLDTFQVGVMGLVTMVSVARRALTEIAEDLGIATEEDVENAKASMEAMSAVFKDELGDIAGDFEKYKVGINAVFGEETPKAAEKAEEAIDKVAAATEKLTTATDAYVVSQKKMGEAIAAAMKADSAAVSDPTANIEWTIGDWYIDDLEKLREVDEERAEIADSLRQSQMTMLEILGLLPDEEPVRDRIKNGSFGEGFQLEMQETQKNLFTIGEKGAYVADSLSDGFSDAWADFATGAASASDAFKRFASDFLIDVGRMIAKQAALNAVTGLFGSSGDNGATSIVGSVVSTAFGGDASDSVASSGPGKMATSSAGRGGGAVVNVHNYAGAKVSTQTSRGPDGRHTIEVFIDAAAADVSKGGKLGKAIAKSYGGKRRGRRA